MTTTSTTPQRIWLSPPHLGGDEESLVAEAFRSNWIAPLGPHVDAFERELAAQTRMRHAAALSSGTAAIHLALRVLDVAPGDEVLCQSFTFAGTVNPVRYVGAVPVLVGSEPTTWNMDPDALRDAIVERRRRGARLRAIIPVHLYGMPARMDEILAVAREFELPVIEDAAEALGSALHGAPCGSFGDVSVLSFNGNKIITTSGGGALLSNEEAWVSRSRFLATQARDPAPHYEHSEIGYNYRLSNILAAIGRGQLRRLGDRVAARRANFARYRAFFGAFDQVSLLDEPTSEYVSNRWLTTIVIDPERSNGVRPADVMQALAATNIEARPLWKPMHLQPVFRDALYVGSDLCERLFAQGLCLPSGSALGDADFERIFAVLRTTLR
jgi:dTDP-4-amino-4,6-dideoxygalactose transaminase